MSERFDEWTRERLWLLRIVHALQEIGILLMAFAPLDGALSDKSWSEEWKVVVGMFLVGLLCFILGVIGEGASMPTSVLVPLAAVLVTAFIGFAYVMYAVKQLAQRDAARKRLQSAERERIQQELFAEMDEFIRGRSVQDEQARARPVVAAGR